MSAIPLYVQVRQAILSDIAAGSFQTGEPMPSEAELCGRFGASRITIRKAVESLVADGVVQKIQGVGTFVRNDTSTGQRVRFRGYLDDILISDPEITVTSQDGIESVLPDHLARLFSIAPGSSVEMTVTVLLRKGKPLMLGRRFIPSGLLQNRVGEDLRPGEQPTVSLFRQAGVLIGRGEQRMHAVCTDRHTAELLGVPERTPLLASWRIYFDRQERPITAIEAIYHPENFEMSMDLVPRVGGRFM